jgi:hypothetical protein
MVADGFPPRIKRREVVPAGGDLDDIVIFTDAEIAFSGVQWAR